MKIFFISILFSNVLIAEKIRVVFTMVRNQGWCNLVGETNESAKSVSENLVNGKSILVKVGETKELFLNPKYIVSIREADKDEVVDNECIRPKITAIGEKIYSKVKESDLQNLTNALNTAKMIPYIVDGTTAGLRFFAIESGSIWDKMGIKNGDILRHIDGVPVSDFNFHKRLMALFTESKKSSTISIEIERNKEIRQLQATIE